MHPEQLLMLILAACVLLAGSRAHPIRSRYCGTHLADALKLACGLSGYNQPSWADDESSNPKGKRTQYIGGVGVATECCYIGCSWRTITSYCAEPHNHKSKKSSGDEDFGLSALESLSRNVEEAQRAHRLGSAPEVGAAARRRGRMGRKGHERRKGRKGNRGGRRRRPHGRGRRRPRCRCAPRRRRPKKHDLGTTRRSDPLVGTVSPEYQRQPRTLDELPPWSYPPMHGYPAGLPGLPGLPDRDPRQA